LNIHEYSFTPYLWLLYVKYTLFLIYLKTPVQKFDKKSVEDNNILIEGIFISIKMGLISFLGVGIFAINQKNNRGKNGRLEC